MLIDHADAVEPMNKKYGPLYVRDTIPAKSCPGQEQVNQVATVWNIIIARADMPDQVACNIVKTIFDKRDELIQVHKEAANFDLENQSSSAASIPYHPGAIKYFAEKGSKLNRPRSAVIPAQAGIQAPASATVTTTRLLGAALAACACASLPAGAATVACGAPALIAPDAPVVSDPRPRIAWAPHPGATAYRVTLTSRVPEGAQLAALDVQTETTSLLPAQPLAVDRALVRVRVTALCPAGDPGQSGDERLFVIDATARCTLSGPVAIRRDGAQVSVGWHAAPAAGTVDVAVYSAADGRLLGQAEARGAEAKLDTATREPVVAVVRPRCAAIAGEWTASTVAH